MRLRILNTGIRDLSSARKFYESQGQGLGSYFLESLFAEINSLQALKGIHRKVSGYHCMYVRRFPYAVYYKVEGSEIRIYRVLDCRRAPDRIRRALEE